MQDMGTFERFEKIETTKKQDDPISLDSDLIEELSHRTQELPSIPREFDAGDELKHVWKKDKKERAQAIYDIKNNIGIQREAWVNCKLFIEEILATNPDININVLQDVVARFSKKYGFSKQSIHSAQDILNKYSQLRQQTKKIRAQYPNDVDLLRLISGVKFSDADMQEVSVQVGIFGFEVTCPAHQLSIIDGTVPEEDSYPYMGWAVIRKIRTEKHPLHLLFINSSAHRTQEEESVTLMHEREHLSHSLLKDLFYSKKSIHEKTLQMIQRPASKFFLKRLLDKFSSEIPLEEKFLNRYDLTKNDEEKDFLLQEYFQWKRKWSLDKTKGEIFAILKDRSLPVYKILDEIFLSDVYDTYDFSKNLIRSSRSQSDKRWKEYSNKILIKEYQSMLRLGLVAVSRLLNSGYSVEETIGLLTDFSIAQWPKVVRRHLESSEAVKRSQKFQKERLDKNTKKYFESLRRRRVAKL